MEYLLIICAYFLGSIPFGLILTKIFIKQDIRTIGSGNIGATNVLRTGKKKLALATLLLDGAKGVIPVILAQTYFEDKVIMLTMVFAVIGHIYPVWLKFKGGKGVATFLAVVASASWQIGVITCFIWLVVFKLSKISSLSAIIGIFVAFFSSLIFASFYISMAIFVSGSLVIYKHKANIKRLIKGQELGFTKK